jgi:site-specific recombinase XerD
MIERSCDGTAPVARRVDCGPLASHFKEFEALLADQGYASATVQSKLHLLDELSRWLKRRKLQAADLDERRINLFLKHRARRCSTQRGETFTIGQLLSFLRGLDCIPINSEVVDATPMGRLEQEFARFLSAERGLKPVTVASYLRQVRHFLLQRFGQKELQLDELCLQDINQFILERVRHVRRSYAQLMVTALRSFLRFLQQRGTIAAELAAAVPAVANMKSWM